MKRTISLIVICLLSLIFFSSFRSVSTMKSHRLMLKVVSSDPNERISFEGAYIFKTNNTTLQLVNQSTPLTIERNSECMSAIFHKLSGKADLQVVLVSVTDSIYDKSATASGVTITVGTHLGQDQVECFAESY
jgi:hypothetical protein